MRSNFKRTNLQTYKHLGSASGRILVQIFGIAIAFLVVTTASLSCKKGVDAWPACETNETSKITFKNNGTTSLRVEMAKTFNASYMPIDAVFTFDLAAGESSVKEFRYGKYFIQWKNNCATKCTQQAFYAKDFVQCEEYTEEQ